MGWHCHNNTSVEDPSLAEIMRMEQGQNIHEYARSQYKEGILVDVIDAENALKLTDELMNYSPAEVIFEPYFRYHGCVARADILIRNNDMWVVEEVKSSTALKPSLVDDLAYTVMVMKGFGIEIDDINLWLVNQEYRLGHNSEPLLKPIDVTTDVLVIAGEFENIRPELEKSVLSGSCPDGQWKWACRECDYFAQHCVGKGIDAPIFQIPRLGSKKFKKLLEIGVTEIEFVPEDFELSDRQREVVNTVQTGETKVKPGLKDALDEWQRPFYYLDFETVSSCIPVYEDMHPYSQVPTQYSLHINGHNGNLEHLEYLAEGSRDCRREFIEMLLTDIGDVGSVVVYSSYENTVLTHLQKWFHDLENDIGAIKDRLVDMEKLISKFVRHPGFKGRTSIKATLPVLVPHMDYFGLEISGGGDASAVFYRLAKGQVQPDMVKSTRKALVEYCKMDTLAMVRIHEVLTRLAYGNTEKLS